MWVKLWAGGNLIKYALDHNLSLSKLEDLFLVEPTYVHLGS